MVKLTVFTTARFAVRVNILLQRNIQHLLHGFNVIKLQALYKVAVNFLHVFFILPAEYYLPQASAFGGQYFFFNAAYWQHLATQRNLPGHGKVGLYLSARKC